MYNLVSVPCELLALDGGVDSYIWLIYGTVEFNDVIIDFLPAETISTVPWPLPTEATPKTVLMKPDFPCYSLSGHLGNTSRRRVGNSGVSYTRMSHTGQNNGSLCSYIP